MILRRMIDDPNRAIFVHGEGALMAKKPSKNTLHGLTRRPPTQEEARAASRAFFATDSSPIVAAILGQAIIETELEELLRDEFRHKDDGTW
jgi:hypothetical protein